MHSTSTTTPRHTFVANALNYARQQAPVATLAEHLDRPVRVYDPVTDRPTYIPLRELRAYHHRAD